MLAQRRARWEALQRFFEQPAPRSFDEAAPEVKGYWDEYVGSARLSWLITAGIVLVPYLGLAVFQLVALARGRAWATDVVGLLLGVGLGLSLFVLLPLWLFFRTMRRRNEGRMQGLAEGPARWVVPERVAAIMHRAGDGPAMPAWELWLWLSDFEGRRALRVVMGRSEAQPEPERVFVVESPRGECLVLWEPGPTYLLKTASERSRSIPGGASPS
ncbi:MAG: hypothetical protein AAF799_42050 [Myxococcota bacterium]